MTAERWLMVGGRLQPRHRCPKRHRRGATTQRPDLDLRRRWRDAPQFQGFFPWAKATRLPSYHRYRDGERIRILEL